MNQDANRDGNGNGNGNDAAAAAAAVVRLRALLAQMPDGPVPAPPTSASATSACSRNASATRFRSLGSLEDRVVYLFEMLTSIPQILLQSRICNNLRFDRGCLGNPNSCQKCLNLFSSSLLLANGFQEIVSTDVLVAIILKAKVLRLPVVMCSRDRRSCITGDHILGIISFKLAIRLIQASFPSPGV